MQENRYIQEDEIDLRELFKTIWDKKVFIIEPLADYKKQPVI